MEVLARGAEAILYKKGDIVLKKRVKKSYRIPQLDIKLRKFRTRLEASLLKHAHRIGINVPAVKKVDEKNFVIVFDYIPGVKLKEFLKNVELNKAKKICEEIGRMVRKLHENGIIHGDLTTSNMLLKDGKIYFIDFGLGFFSSKVEDKATDLYLFHEALESTHPEILEECWKATVKGYKKESRDASKVLERIRRIEKRRRYAQ